MSTAVRQAFTFLGIRVARSRRTTLQQVAAPKIALREYDFDYDNDGCDDDFDYDDIVEHFPRP